MSKISPQKRKKLPSFYSFNFKPSCKMHLRNLRKTLEKATKEMTGDIFFQKYACVALPVLDEMINVGNFNNLPEFPNVKA